MANPWFRLYSEFSHDPKVQMMSEAMQRRYIMIMCLRCSNDLVTLHVTELAFHLRITDAELAETKELFISKGFIDEEWNLLNWDKRQFKSDSSTERVSRHRANKLNNCNVTPPLPKQGSNALDTDTDTDTDKPVNPLSDKSDGVRLANGKQKFKDDAIQVLEFLNQKTGKHYRPLKANLDLIAARLAEGAQVSDCRGIIVRQARKWMGTDQEMYLRPATLFNATKFAQYSGEISHD